MSHFSGLVVLTVCINGWNTWRCTHTPLELESLSPQNVNESLKYKFYCKIYIKLGHTNCPKRGIILVYNTIRGTKDTDGMANSIDPDQTTLFGAV